jgi:Fe-S-cluster containining protein
VKGDVYLSPMEASTIATYLKLSPREFKDQYIAQEEIVPFGNQLNATGWTVLKNSESLGCIFLDDKNMCKIYNVRPWQCVSYPFWPEIMLSSQSWNNEVVVPETNNSFSGQPSNGDMEPKRWTFEDGGCEGMQPIGSMESDISHGVPVDDAQRMLDSYKRYKRTFPIGRPFRLI